MRLDANLRLQNDVYSPRYNRPQAGYGICSKPADLLKYDSYFFRIK